MLGFAYAGARGFTLVYTGEHYITDLLLGAGVALAVHGAGALLTDRKVRLLEAAVQPARAGSACPGVRLKQDRAKRVARMLASASQAGE